MESLPAVASKEVDRHLAAYSNYPKLFMLLRNNRCPGPNRVAKVLGISEIEAVGLMPEIVFAYCSAQRDLARIKYGERSYRKLQRIVDEAEDTSHSIQAARLLADQIGMGPEKKPLIQQNFGSIDAIIKEATRK